jgi:hypothetical protein
VSPEELRTTIYSSNILQGRQQPVWRSEALNLLSLQKRKTSAEKKNKNEEPDALETAAVRCHGLCKNSTGM